MTEFAEVIGTKIIRQLGIILLICFLGDALQKLLKLPIPGNVLGMIILLLCLLTGIIKLDMVEDIYNFLIEHLTFLFLPAGVGLIACKYSITNWIDVFIICFVTTIIVMVITGKVVEFLKRS